MSRRARLSSSARSAALLVWVGLLAAGCGDEPPRHAVAGAVAAPAAAAVEDTRPVVLFLGDSLTAGYGLSSDQAFPALLQKKMDDAGLSYRAVNAGVSGDTSAGGLRRIDWLLKMPIAVLVIELGGNDMLRGLDPDAMRLNLESIIAKTRDAHAEVRIVIAGMRAAPNLGAAYVLSFEAVYTDLAKAEDAVLIPFLLEGVAATRSLNQPDGIHPTAEGHRIVSDTVWASLEPVLR